MHRHTGERISKERTMGYRWVMTNYDLRLAARKQLDGAWGEMVIAQFIWALPAILLYLSTKITGVEANSLYSYLEADYLNTSAESYFADAALNLLSYLITGPLTVGLAGFYLKRIRGQQISAGNVFDGFKNFWRSVLLGFLADVFLTLWVLLLVIPGIVKFYSYSMSFFIMRDNPGMGPLRAITKSRQMMDGFKAKLFMLYVSFLGWFLLCLLPAFIGAIIFSMAEDSFYGSTMTTIGWMVVAIGVIGILILWLYIGLAKANFYEDLKRCREQQEADLVESVDSKESEDSKEPADSTALANSTEPANSAESAKPLEPAGSSDSESPGGEKQPPEEDGEKRRLSGLDPKTWEN